MTTEQKTEEITEADLPETPEIDHVQKELDALDPETSKNLKKTFTDLFRQQEQWCFKARGVIADQKELCDETVARYRAKSMAQRRHLRSLNKKLEAIRLGNKLGGRQIAAEAILTHEQRNDAFHKAVGDNLDEITSFITATRNILVGQGGVQNSTFWDNQPRIFQAEQILDKLTELARVLAEREEAPTPPPPPSGVNPDRIIITTEDKNDEHS